MPQEEKPQLSGMDNAPSVKRDAKAVMHKAGRLMIKAARGGYAFCYVVGAHAIRFTRRFWRRAGRAAAPVRRLAFRALDWLVLRRVRRAGQVIAAEARRFAAGFPLAGRQLRAAFAKGFGTGMAALFMLPFRAGHRHKGAVGAVGNLLAPIAAVAALVVTVQYWSGMTFALAVEYEGQTLGYVQNEGTYDQAASMASARVINADNSFQVERTPKMTIAVVSKSDILSESDVADKILKSSGDSIAEGSGLYIGDNFEGAVQSRSDLDALLQSLLNQYSDGSSDERAEFLQDVKVVDGLYPISSVVSADTLKEQLTRQTVVDKYYTIVKGDAPLSIARKTGMTLDELRSLNPGFDGNIFPDVQILIQKAQPYLRVKVIRTVEYTEEIAFKTVEVQDADKYIGDNRVRTQGQNGEQKVKAEITLVDGIEQSRTILETTQTKAPVDKVIAKGAKKINPSVSAAGDGIVKGRFIYPLPSCTTIYSGYGYRSGGFHAGVDFSGNGVYGKPIVAADGGTVKEANSNGWGGGYGKYVIIDHGGGVTTMYAHMSAVAATAGAKVSQGQVIGYVGSTGQSSGPHLHFEIRINGKTVNPRNYLG